MAKSLPATFLGKSFAPRFAMPAVIMANDRLGALALSKSNAGSKSYSGVRTFRTSHQFSMSLMDYITKHRGVAVYVCSQSSDTWSTTMQNELLNRAEVCRFFGSLNASTLYRGIRQGRYPRPVKVGPGSSRWLRSECEAVLQNMVDGRAA